MGNFELTYNEAAYGNNKPLPAFEKLQAGDIFLEYGQGSIRYLKVGDTEILRMAYFAVRDHNWDTIPMTITQENISIDDGTFTINFKGVCQLDAIDFSWDCSISGSTDNQIIFNIKGTANSTFDKNRVGFCVLHPIAECQGIPCTITSPEGTKAQYLFPKNISPHQPMMDIRKMEWKPSSTLKVSLLMEGDVFEMEDQRNWTDDSYKTYCTPLGLPFPVTLNQGETIEQTLSLLVENKAGNSAKKNEENLIQFNTTGKKVVMPAIGIGASSEYQNILSASEEKLRKIPFHHYRIDIDFSDHNWKATLEKAIATSKQLNTKLLIALFFSENASEETEALIEEIGAHSNILNTIYIFDKERKTTSNVTIHHVIDNLRKSFPQAIIGGGTNAYFAELNRERVDTSNLDALTFSVNPQVHAFDNDSLTETLQAQQYAVDSAKHFSNGLTIHVSPITLQPRFNPNATGPEPPQKPNELPSQTDIRQMSLYAASWLVGSIQYLAAANCKQVTYFETLGTRGIIQGEKAPLLPNLFKAFSGSVFPIYHVLRFLLTHEPKELALFKSSNRLKSELLIAINAADEKVAIVSNFSQEKLKINIDPQEVFKGELEYLVVDPHDTQALMKDENYITADKFKTAQNSEGKYMFDLPAFGLIFIKNK